MAEWRFIIKKHVINNLDTPLKKKINYKYIYTYQPQLTEKLGSIWRSVPFKNILSVQSTHIYTRIHIC